MSYVNPTPFIDQLKKQLGETAAWPAAGGVDDNIHYPHADASETPYPAVVLEEENVSYEKEAYGMSPFPSGSLLIYLSDKTGVGQIESLARLIGDQICVDLGLVNLSVSSITPSDTPSAKEEASGDFIYMCIISLSFGITL